MAILIKGSEIAKQIKQELKEEINNLLINNKLVPGLATVLVGEDEASKVYVGAKEKACKELGIYSERIDLFPDTTENDLLVLIDKLNKNAKIHGILVQLPLPRHINETKVLYAIDPQKDVDAFHPVNVGKLMLGVPDFLPCTPHGIQELLLRTGIEQYCRQADCEHADSEEQERCKRYCYNMPHRYEGFTVPHQKGGYPHCGSRQAKDNNRRYGEGRCCRYRCRG
jgi:5,10-methylene-tetrahydrofolate dehydrogenase/methenyl tetrahydrofolate cyclohydrolase